VPAPIALGATVMTSLSFCLVNINPVVGGCAGGDVGEGAVGRRTRSFTYPPGFRFLGSARHAIVQALVVALLVIEAEPGADAGIGAGVFGASSESHFLWPAGPGQVCNTRVKAGQ
jgi:hypothetical protein